MKKALVLALCVCAVCYAAFAAFSTQAVKTVVAFPAASVASGATSTNTFTVAGYRGLGELNIAIGDVATASSNRTVTVTFEGSVTENGTYTTINTGSWSGAKGGILRIPFIADYLPKYVRVKVANTTAASVVSGLFMAY